MTPPLFKWHYHHILLDWKRKCGFLTLIGSVFLNACSGPFGTHTPGQKNTLTQSCVHPDQKSSILENCQALNHTLHDSSKANQSEFSGPSEPPITSPLNTDSALTLEEALTPDTGPTSSLAPTVLDSIISYGRLFLGKPYRYRGPASKPMDCSGYLQHIFGKFGFTLPSSSSAYPQFVEKLELKDVQKGDVLIFKGRNSRNKHAGHVGLVIERTDTSLSMMHSCQRGILIETFPDFGYYSKRFMFGGRIPPHSSFNYFSGN